MDGIDFSLAELFEQYKEEVRESIETLDAELVAIEQDPGNSEVIFSIFRHLHSLKGSSRMFNVENIGLIAHKLEDLMQLIDQNNSILSRFPGIVDLLFKGNDIFREIIARLEADIGFVHLTPAHTQFIEQVNHQLKLLDRKENVLLEKVQILLDELEAVLPTLEESESAGLVRAVKELAGSLSWWTMESNREGVRYSYGGQDFTQLILDYESGLTKFKADNHTPEDVAAFLKNIEELIRSLFEVAEENLMPVLQELNDGLDMYNQKSLEIDPVVIEFFSGILTDLKENIKVEVGPLTVEAGASSEIKGGVPEGLTEPVPEPQRSQVKTVRVDEKKIDLFLDSVGKLITQSEILQHLQFSFKQAGISPALLRDFTTVNRTIANDVLALQRSIMEVRQVEIANILKKFPRLVRDISHEMNKQVELVISGERTPIDKSLLDDVENALIHIVRNAIDHGLETPAEREAAGKDPRGRIDVKVEQEETSVVIEVTDNGRGVDFETVRGQAFNRGMISREQYETMTDEQSEALLFKSGVTTKAEATDISGRGVGLDVVMSNVRKWNGWVSLVNRPGQGLSILLIIPITNTLLTKEAILLKLGGLTFCLPLEQILEIVTIPEDRLHRHQGQSVFQHRNQVIGVVDIYAMLGLDLGKIGDSPSKTFIILRGKRETRKAIGVDEVLGQQKIVIKDFDLEAFQRLPYCQGLSMLGDGRVVLILDADSIVD